MNPNIADQERSQADLQFLHDLPRDRQSGTVIKWLTGGDTRRSALVLGIVHHHGEAGVSLLFSEAIALGKKAQHRLKLLQALEKTERSLSIGQWFELMTVMPRFSSDVREQMSRLLALRRPRDR